MIVGKETSPALAGKQPAENAPRIETASAQPKASERRRLFFIKLTEIDVETSLLQPRMTSFTLLVQNTCLSRPTLPLADWYVRIDKEIACTRQQHPSEPRAVSVNKLGTPSNKERFSAPAVNLSINVVGRHCAGNFLEKNSSKLPALSVVACCASVVCRHVGATLHSSNSLSEDPIERTYTN